MNFLVSHDWDRVWLHLSEAALFIFMCLDLGLPGQLLDKQLWEDIIFSTQCSQNKTV
jgi:hypothetical protein